MALNTIKAKNYLDINEEYLASGAVTPGMLVEQNAATTVRAHATAGGNAVPMFACEDELQGGSIDDVFATTERIPAVWIPQRGDQVYAILADGNNAAIGDFLESNGAGLLQVHVGDQESWESATPSFNITVYPLQIVGVALEAVDISDSSGGESSGTLGYDKRILIRVV